MYRYHVVVWIYGAVAATYTVEAMNESAAKDKVRREYLNTDDCWLEVTMVKEPE